jgi:hypothetical protein
MEVAGCPTICQHCWAQGVPYAVMPIETIYTVLEASTRFFAERQLAFTAYPMHEIVAHPEAPQIIRLFQQLLGEDPGFEPLATTAVPLSSHERPDVFLKELQKAGIRTFFVAFHGRRTDHDMFVHRQGAFDETYQMAQKIRSHGFQCGANVFVTKPVVQHFDEMRETLQALDLTSTIWEPASYYPIARSRKYEHHRVALDDVMSVADQIAELSLCWKDKWLHIQEYTEARWTEKAQENTWLERICPPVLSIVCRPNLDIFIGKAGLYGIYLGNGRQNTFESIFQKALEMGPVEDDQLYYKTATIPPIQELARTVGDKESTAIYFQDFAVRYRWIDRLLKNTRSTA